MSTPATLPSNFFDGSGGTGGSHPAPAQLPPEFFAQQDRAARLARSKLPPPPGAPAGGKPGSAEWQAWAAQRIQDNKDTADAMAPAAPHDAGFWSGLGSQLASAVDPTPAIKAILSTGGAPTALIKMAYDALQGQVDQGHQAADAWRKGDRTEATGHAMAAALPLLGPAAANAGEAIGEGRTGEGLGQAVGLVGTTLLAPELMERAPGAVDMATNAAKSVAAETNLAGVIDAAKAANDVRKLVTSPNPITKAMAVKRLLDRVPGPEDAASPPPAAPPAAAPAPPPLPGPATLTDADKAFIARRLAQQNAPAPAPRTDLSPHLGYQAQDADFAPAPAAPAPAAPAPAPAAPVEPPAPAPGPVTPAEPPPAALTPAQRLEDAADEQAARLHMQAQDIEWANRAHKADRFAAYLLKNKLDPTHENLTAAAKALAERKVPSADTVDMIHDRMGYDPPQAAQTAAAETPATPAPAGPDLEQQLRDSIAAAQAKKGIPPEAAGAPPPGTLAQISPNSIKADPVRFQFKRDTGGAAGVGDKLKSVDTYNPDLGGILNVWHDPADGQTYVVNGHHRLDLAQRANAPSVDVRYIDAANAPEARAKGALINIAEDQGTPLDAAKLFRDTGISPADLKSRGISLSGKTARAGLGLSKLDQGIFDQVVSGDIPEANASIIGEMLPDRFADQRAVINAIDKAAARGKAMTPAQIQESIRVGMRPENQITETQDTLFGTESETRSLFAETGEISDYVRKQLSQEKRLFGSVSSSGAAERLGGAGNVINAEENSRIAGETKQAQAVYDKLSGMSGPVSDALAAGAKELATSGENPNAIKARTYESVRRAISETLSGAKGRVPEGLPPGDSDGVGQAPGPAPGDLFAPEVKPPAKRVRKIGDLGKLGDR